MLLSAIVMLSACAAKKPVAQSAAVQDGSSFEKAIVIKATNDRAGVDEEYAWLRSNYPDAKTRSQKLVMHDKKPFDILNVVTADGKSMELYFDISSSFGKL